MNQIKKYPRTRHILDSRLQKGDENLSAAGFADIKNRHLVIEEKVDGANAAISFDQSGELMLQSRGHYLTGGRRERHFALFKSWAHGIKHMLWPVLGTRYIVYGEWLYAKHTIYYDALPHFFLEFDVLDRKTDHFLSTPKRRQLLNNLALSSVPVLHEGKIASPDELTAMIDLSLYKSPDWQANLADDAGKPPNKPEMVMAQTDPSDLMEGLYIKMEQGGEVVDRFKYVRHSFLATVINSESHWQSRPILPNRLENPGVMFAGG